MAFSAEELVNISNAVIDYHETGVKSQAVQRRPLFDDLQAGAKEFPGGKEFITTRVKGVYSSSMVGYSHDDEQAYVNPANIKMARASWYEVAGGIKVTFTELKKAGISVVDSVTGSKTVKHSQAEKVALVDLLEDKIDDLKEGNRRSFAEMLWRDGSQDAKAVPGIKSFILDAPTTGTTFGIDRAQNSFWRNRATLAITVSTPGDLNLTNRLQQDFRQLRRFTTPKHKAYAGSTWLTEMEKELRSKGDFTLEGWAKKGAMDMSTADIMFKGVSLEYDPTLDDLSLEKYLYILDLKAIKLRPMENEAWKKHTPARPPEQYVMYQAETWTGGLIANMLRSSGVYSTA